MPFSVPESKKSIKQNRFEFTIGDTTYDIPLLKFLPVAGAEAFEAGRSVEGILSGCDSEAAKDAIRALDGDQFGALMDAWQEASGVDVGESGASSDS